MLLYILHPWFIVLVRGAAKLTGTTGVVVDNRLVLFVLVSASSAAAAFLLPRLGALLRRPQPSVRGRAWIEISRDALSHNARQLQALLPPSCRLLAVVKADAYGHGAGLVTGVLEKAGVCAFAVATLAEGIALRRSGIKGEVLILGYTHPGDATTIRRYRLTQTVLDLDYARQLNDAGVRLDVHVKIDTGMHRLGTDSENISELETIFSCENLSVKGMYTHLSEADSLKLEALDNTLRQIRRFNETISSLKAKGYHVGKLHVQESYGILNYPGLPCDYARAGIALYGVLCKNDQTRLSPGLQPVLSMKARVAEVRWIKAGEAVGYSRRFVAPSLMKIAAVTIGYADGIPRNSDSRDAYVLLSGLKAPILGLICMDVLIVDATLIDDVKPGDVATLIGRDGEELIRCEDVAESCGTITNELLSRLGARLPRMLV
jgi:serine/alanine racemase